MGGWIKNHNSPSLQSAGIFIASCHWSTVLEDEKAQEFNCVSLLSERVSGYKRRKFEEQCPSLGPPGPKYLQTKPAAREKQIHHTKSQRCTLQTVRYSTSGGNTLPWLGSPVASPSSWQQQPVLWMRGRYEHAGSLYAPAPGPQPAHCTGWQEAGRGQPNAEISEQHQMGRNWRTDTWGTKGFDPSEPSECLTKDTTLLAINRPQRESVSYFCIYTIQSWVTFSM